MKAVGYHQPGPIDRADALLDLDLPSPEATGRDLLVEVKAVSVNPVDTKVRATTPPDHGARVLGFDAAGVVLAAGPNCTLFSPGDEVFYAGSIARPGSNSERQLVDERIAGRKPRSLDWGAAAALPLTALTAWECLFHRMEVRRPVAGGAPALLIIGGAGGVGSIAIQLARQLTELVVIGTASRPETQAWAADMGAHHVIDHSQPLAAEVAALGLGSPSFVFSTTQTDRHASQIADLIAPQGRLGVIDDLAQAGLFKRKCVSIHWEFMFARAVFDTPDIGEQGALLNEVSRLVDEGVLRSTATARLGPINAANLKRAHALVESGTVRGKLVLEGFEP